MKLKKVVIVGLYFYTIHLCSTLWAIELVSPPQNAVVHPGDTITIKVVPSPGERIGRVYFGGLGGAKIDVPPYEYQYQIGPHDVGDFILDIFAIKPESDGPFASADEQFSSSIELHLKSSLSPNVKLQSIILDPRQGSLYLEPEIARTKQLGVGGVFSDGVQRSIKGSAFGNTYKSNNEKVVTVDSEGVLHAVSVGKAIVMVKNGDKTAQITVNVYSKP